MIVTFTLSGEKLQHMTNQQYGAFVAHCYGLKRFHSIKLWKTSVEVSFSLNGPSELVDQEKIQGQLETEIAAFASMEPFPCPCGCGAFISVSPCLRQSGDLVDNQPEPLNAEEALFMRQGNKIGAIKSYRQRVSDLRKTRGLPEFIVGLKDAKDICEAWLARYLQEHSKEIALGHEKYPF